MTYTKKFSDTVIRDELMGDPVQKVRLVNVQIESDTTLSRGALIAADDLNSKFKMAGASDAEKTLLINVLDVPSGTSVVTACASGTFNREKIVVADGVDISDFETELRKQNIFLTSIK